MNDAHIRQLVTCGVSSLAGLLLSACLSGCTTEYVTADTARAMSTPGMGPEKFSPPSLNEALSVGDQLQLTVLGYPEFNTTTPVKSNGTIAIPLIGEVKAVGFTKDQLEAEIVRRLSDYVKSKVYVTLNLTSATVQNIVVLGAVVQQNSFPNTASVSIFQLLANAGGPVPDADLRHIKVYRGGNLAREEELDLSGIVSPGNRPGRGTPMINPGDLVYVPKSENFMREFSPFLYDIVVVLTLFSLLK